MTRAESITFIAGAGMVAVWFGVWQQNVAAGTFLFWLLLLVAYLKTLPSE